MGQDIFERKINQAYKNCKGVIRIADDVQVFDHEETTYDRICMKKRNALEKKALSIILLNVLLRRHVTVLITYTVQKVSNLT